MIETIKAIILDFHGSSRSSQLGGFFWMKEIWGDRVFSAEEVKEMREAELGDRS